MERIAEKVSIKSSVAVGPYLAVGVDGAPTAATGATVYGITVDGNNGRPELAHEIVVDGECYATIGEAVAAGDVLTGGANGKLMKASAGVDFGFAIALEGGVADDVITVKML